MGFTRILRPDLARIDKVLQDGHAVIVRARSYLSESEEWGHIFLITQRNEKSFFCVNTIFGHCWLKKSRVQSRYLKHSLMAWTVRRPLAAHLRAA